jgi:O-antigen/teichoic acid export membrane protein
MSNFSGDMFIESIAIALFQQLDRIIVGFTLGPAAAGVYSVGTSAGLRMAIVSGQVTEVMIPYASRKDSIHAGERLYAVFRQLSRTISLLVAALGGVLVIWMDEILSLWISPGYASAYSGIFRLMIVAYGILSLSRPAHQTLTGIGQVRFTSLVYLVTALSMLAALYVLSLRLGFFGAALANFIPLLLLSFNLYTYQRLAQRIVWRQVFGDLIWGLSVPLALLMLVSLDPTSWMKVLWTALLGLLLALIAFKDEGLRPLLAGRMRRFAPK